MSAHIAAEKAVREIAGAFGQLTTMSVVYTTKHIEAAIGEATAEKQRQIDELVKALGRIALPPSYYKETAYGMGQTDGYEIQAEKARVALIRFEELSVSSQHAPEPTR